MEMFKRSFVIAFLLVIYVYACNITFLPSSIIVFEGEPVNIKTLAGINVNKNDGGRGKVIKTSSDGLEATTYDSAGLFELNLDLFGTIPLKEIDVNVIPKTKVIPSGDLIGVKMYTSGVLVVGFSEIEGQDSIMYKPYFDTGIEEGDMIVEMNNKQICSSEDLVNVVNKSNGEKIEVKYIRANETITTSITPVKDQTDEYKLGLWVRDAAAGVGTLTFYEPSTGNYAALGHGISDVDTGDILQISNGELVSSRLVSINKGEKYKPGEIQGSIDGGASIGGISKNTNFGVYGKVSNISNLDISNSEECEVALRNEISVGEAEVICELEEGKKEKYKIQIEKIYSGNNYDNKSMLIRVTDENLINKTGGIVQGMSGSPIIQNGKFVGAITNVLVSDPTMGYAIFGDLMIKQMRSTNVGM